jgi:enoyl-CoA hydratase
MEFKNIKFDLINNYSILTFDRIEKHNALNNQILTELSQCIDYIKNLKENKGLIITGSGEKSFVAGADIFEIRECNKNDGKEFSEFGSNIFRTFSELEIVTIAAINGFAFGGGLELALACNLRFASENAKFSFPEINLGLMPGYGGTQRLPRLIGKSLAFEMIITGKTIDAEEALRIGLINAIFKQSELLPDVEKIMASIAQKPKAVIKSIIKCINFADSNSISEGLKFESEAFGEISKTNDFIEGTTAFIEKRKPNFTDK